MKFTMKEEGGFKTELPYGELHVSGNEEFGFRPYQLLISSIAVCSGGVFRTVAEKMRLNVTNIEVETTHERIDEEAGRVASVHMKFFISGTDLNEAKIEKALHVTRKNCSMVRSVESSIAITESFEIV